MREKWQDDVKLTMTSLIIPQDVLTFLKTKSFLENISISELIRQAIYEKYGIDKTKYRR